MQNLVFKSLAFARKSNQWVEVLVLPQLHKKVYNSTHSYPLGLSNVSFDAKFSIENVWLFTMHPYPWFKGLAPLFIYASMHQIF